MLKKITLILCVASLTSSCTSEAQTAVGVWEIRYKDAVGQDYLDVLELTPEGRYTTHMQSNAPSDRGTYSLSDEAISFQSEVNPAFSRDVPYEFEGDVLRVLVGAPGIPQPIYVDWQRSALQRYLPHRGEPDRAVPGELPQTIARLTAARQVDRPDAVPTSITLEAQPHGEYTVVAHIYSEEQNDELRAFISPYHLIYRFNSADRAVKQPLPPEFLDLPAVLEYAAAHQVAGTLRKADLQVWGDHGAVWRLSMNDNSGGAFSAVTGEKIEGDVTGYREQYEADWSEARELWQKAFERFNGDDDDDDEEWPSCNNNVQSSCEAYHCYWKEPQNPLNDGYCSDYPS